MAVHLLHDLILEMEHDLLAARIVEAHGANVGFASQFAR